MQKSNNDILNFINNQKYILIIILIVSLIISYIIQKNTPVLVLDKVKKVKNEKKSPKVIFTDYNYYIWYNRNYSSGYMSLIIGRVFENMGIETFKDNKVEQIPSLRQTNTYGFFIIRTLDPINENVFNKKFELEKKNFIEQELDIINNFRSTKKDNNLLIEKEYNLFKIANAKIYFKENKRIRETTSSYAKEIIFKYNGNEEHYSKNIKFLVDYSLSSDYSLSKRDFKDVGKSNNKLYEKKLFYYPEIVILILYISYFSLYFFIQLIREND